MRCSKNRFKREVFGNKYIKKNEVSQMNTLTLYLKELEKGEQTKPIINKIKEMQKKR
jgi:hypothetical protein